MKKSNKTKSVMYLLITALMIFSLAGCGSKKVSLTEAFENTSKVKSFKFKGNLKLNAEGEGIDPQVQTILQGFNAELTGDCIQHDKTSAQLKLNTKFSVLGMNMDLDIFEDIKMGEDGLNGKVFIQIPEILKVSVPELNEFKYIYYDINKLLDEQLASMGGQVPELDMNKLMVSSKKLVESSGTFMKKYLDENKEIVIDKEKQDVEINGQQEKLQVYEVKINNDELKKFLKEILKDENMKKDFVELLRSVPDAGVPENEAEINEGFEEILKEIDNMPNVITDEGITLTFAIKDGVIVKNILDFNVEIEGTKLNYNLTMDMFNVDDKNIKIDFPDEKGSDCINMFEMMKSMDQFPVN
jgi:hypothetical protein